MWYNKGGVVTEWISNRTWQTSNTETGSGYRTNTRNRLHWKIQAPVFDWDRYIGYQKSRVRSKVEYVFLILKQLFRYRKVCNRGIAKPNPCVRSGNLRQPVHVGAIRMAHGLLDLCQYSRHIFSNILYATLLDLSSHSCGVI